MHEKRKIKIQISRAISTSMKITKTVQEIAKRLKNAWISMKRDYSANNATSKTE